MPVLGTKLHLPSPRRRLVPAPALTDQLRADAGVDAAAGPRRGAGRVRQDHPADPVAGVGRPRTEPAGRARVAWLSLDAGDADLRAVPDPPRRRAPDHQPGGRCRGAGPAGERARTSPTEDVLVSLVNDLDALAGPDRARARRLPRHRRAGRPRGGDVPARQPAAAGHPRHDHARGPAAAAVPAARPRRARRAARRGPAVHRRRGGRVPQRRDGPRARAGARGRARGAHRGLGGRAAAGRAVGPRPHRAPATSAASSTPSPAATGSSWTTWSRRCCDSQPDDVRAFLLDTSVLRPADRRRSATRSPAAPTASQMLETLERGEPVRRPARRPAAVVPLPPPVRRRAARPARCAEHPDRVAGLHRAASRWHAEHGLLADAVAHAIAGGDAERAADLVELALPDLRRHRQDRTLRDWLRALPDDVVRRRPLLATFAGLGPALRGRPRRGRGVARRTPRRRARRRRPLGRAADGDAGSLAEAATRPGARSCGPSRP